MADNEEALKELGRIAAERRESIGMTLETVFDRTKIRLEYLKGIEEGNYSNFPEIVYIKGFVRTYLKLINAEDLQDDFMTQLDIMGGSASPRKHEPRPHTHKDNLLGNGSSFPKGFKPASHFWVFLVLIAALIGTGTYVWYALTYGGLDLKNLKLFSFSGAGGPMTVTPGSSSDIITSADGAITGVPVSVDVSADEEPEELEAKPFIEIQAVNDVWLSVIIGTGQPVYRRTLRRGETMRWELTAPARVVFGRPTAAQVIHNGKDLGIVNPRGCVD